MSKKTKKTSFLGYKIEAGNVILNGSQFANIEQVYKREGKFLTKYAPETEQETLDEFIPSYVNELLKDNSITDVNVTSYQQGASKDAILSETMKTIKADALTSFTTNTANEDVVTYGKNKYIKDEKGNWKALSITFTIRADKQNGYNTPDDMQKMLNKLADKQNKKPSEDEVQEATKGADVVESANVEDVLK